MTKIFFAAIIPCILLTACSHFFTPEGWPLEIEPQNQAVAHLKKHVKFTGSGIRLTEQEKALLTFLNNEDILQPRWAKRIAPVLTSGLPLKFTA